MDTSHSSLISELEDAIHSGSREKRIDTLRRVTDLFLADADRLNEQQISLFDDVIGHLIQKIETRAMIELSSRLAPVGNAPIEVVKQLAWNDEIAIAGPVLSHSARLTPDNLVAIANAKGRQHLLAISGRAKVEPAVTDALLARDDREVRYALAKNGGAAFSDSGFETLVKNAETDGYLAEKVGLRIDVPLKLLRDLLAKATETVRRRLLAAASQRTREEVRRVLEKTANVVGQEVAVRRDFTEARRAVALMQMQGTLNEAALFAYASDQKYEEVVAALAALCATPIELVAPLMRSVRYDGLLVACRAAALKWDTVRAILKSRIDLGEVDDSELNGMQADYSRISQTSAQRTLRFWQIRQAALK